MKKLILATLIMCLAISGANAELEPNNDCVTATPISVGDPMEASLSPAGDVDYFELVITDAGEYIFVTAPGVGQTGGDTELTIYASDCSTVLAYNDQGVSDYSYLFVNLNPGTYYVLVNEYYGDEIGAYVLSIIVPVANNTCDGAINLDGQQQFVVDTCVGYSDTYHPSSGTCTYHNATHGVDATYFVDLPTNGQIDVCIDGDIQVILYLVTDCSDIEGSCVAGSQDNNPACLSYSGGSGRYYLIVDSYSDGHDGTTSCTEITVTVDNLVPTDDTSFSTIKSLF